MILELKIKNFLSFKNEVIFSFEATSDKTLEDYYVTQMEDGTRILNMAMVYGANASGKSNLIHAFEFLNEFTRNLHEKDGINNMFVPFLFDETSKEPGVFELVFYAIGKKHKYQLIVNKNVVLEEKLFVYPGTQPASIFNRYFNAEKEISVVEFGPKIKISAQALEAIQLKALKNISVFDAYSQVNISIPELEIATKWFDDQFLSPINPYTELTEFSDEAIKNSIETKMNALNFLKEADFNITDVEFVDKVEKIPKALVEFFEKAPISEERKAQIKKEGAIPVEETFFTHRVLKNNNEEFHPLSENRQSRGTMRYYGLSAPFFHAIENNAFLPIDEIGSALHPLLVFHFLREFLQKSNQAQLLFTTHNMSILNEKDMLRKDAIWFTEKQEDGATELFSMADFNFRKELSFYNAYKIGKFGGIPEL